MAKRETNEKKRAEFQSIIENLLGPLGWSQKDLTAYVGCPISAFKHGKSMGTNSFRAWMAAIPARNTPGLRAQLLKLRDNAVSHLKSENDSFAKQTDLQEHIKGVTKRREYDIKYHTEALAEAHVEGAKSKAGDVTGLHGWEATRRLEYATKVAEGGLKAAELGLTRYEWDVQYHTEKLEEAQKLDVQAEAERCCANYAGYYQKRIAKAEKALAVCEKNLAGWKDEA